MFCVWQPLFLQLLVAPFSCQELFKLSYARSTMLLSMPLATIPKLSVAVEENDPSGTTGGNCNKCWKVSLRTNLRVLLSYPSGLAGCFLSCSRGARASDSKSPPWGLPRLSESVSSTISRACQGPQTDSRCHCCRLSIHAHV